MPSERLRILESIADVAPSAWNALLPPQAPPFVRHEWLSAMELSGSAVPKAGWTPRHLTLWRGEALVAACPAYLKAHSFGEYVYDFGWAHAAERAGIAYYPKLILAAPLSPIEVTRFLCAPAEATALRQKLAQAALAVAKDEGASSVHALFCTEEEAAALEPLGFFSRLGAQYQWHNPGYRDYDHFLSRFDAKRRHQLRRERRAPAEQAIEIVTVRAPELGLEHAKLAHRFYVETNRKNPWGRIQLTEGFFERVVTTLPESTELVVARRGGRIIAGAFNLATQERLFGRYWGAIEDHPFLHFNVCFYHSIEACIAEGKKVFEPGAGGEHKLPRGFVPTAIHSAHRVFDRRLEKALRSFCQAEAMELAPLLAAPDQVAGLKPFVP